MNQYIHKDDVSRLLEPASGNGQGLVAQITKRPFSVVLFDEIEKAHPDIINVFLQLLDEGTLKDTNNRNVSFKDSIIIATSNAGADVIRQKVAEGQKLEEFEKQFIDDLINAGSFKPEFLNRFDEIVLFRPLNEDELLQIVDILIANVNKTLARQKVAVSLTQEAKVWLVKNGNDPRMGARPLRRMVQRSVENIVAEKLLKNKIMPGSTATLDVSDLQAGAEGS